MQFNIFFYLLVNKVVYCSLYQKPLQLVMEVLVMQRLNFCHFSDFGFNQLTRFVSLAWHAKKKLNKKM